MEGRVEAKGGAAWEGNGFSLNALGTGLVLSF